jgi:hypothetical protein
MPGPFTSSHTLSWNANTESDLAGYIVYAGRATGVYGELNTPTNVGNVTSHTFTIDDSGQWFFAVKAYDTSNNESDFSTEVSGNWLMLGNF